MALSRRLPLVSDRPLARAGLKSERVLWPDRTPAVDAQVVAQQGPEAGGVERSA